MGWERGRFSVWGRWLAMGAGAAVLSACAVAPEPLTLDETRDRVAADRAAAYGGQEPIDGALTLHEAMARAIRYNLDRRLRVMEEALSLRQLEAGRFDLLPRVTANAGYEGRSNVSASSSRSILTGTQSLEPSTSLEEDRLVGDLTVVWNVLDFGVSYFTARQQADRTLIASERRRRVVHQIVQDVRVAYWRALAADRLLERIDPLLERVQTARADSEQIAQLRLQSPVQALTYQRTLLETLQRLQRLRRDLAFAKTQLQVVINAPLDREIELVAPSPAMQEIPEIPLTPAELELLALTYRPELREEQYQARIARDEVRKAMARMLPGLELNAGVNFDSNSFLVNNEWASYGARVTWNLLSLISGPAQVDAAEAEQAVTDARRLALSVAAISQVYVAWQSYQELQEELETNLALLDVEGQIRDQLSAAARVQALGELAVIQAELNTLVAEVQAGLTEADLRTAIGQIFLSIGADPLPTAIADASVETLAAALQETEQGWYRGEVRFGGDAPPADLVTSLVPTWETAAAPVLDLTPADGARQVWRPQ